MQKITNNKLTRIVTLQVLFSIAKLPEMIIKYSEALKRHIHVPPQCKSMSQYMGATVARSTLSTVQLSSYSYVGQLPHTAKSKIHFVTESIE